MKNAQLEALLIAARPHAGKYSPLTMRVMEQIRRQAPLERQLRVPTPKTLFGRLRALHGAGLAVVIVVAMVLLGSIAYASVRYVPDLIRLLDKKHNSVGRIEYSVPSFKDCYGNTDIWLDKFEVLPSAHLSDEDVQRTLSAKCELLGMSKFANDTWPTYGEHSKWKDGDTIYYTRPDAMGTVENITKKDITLRESTGNLKTLPLLDGRAPQVYSRAVRAASSSLQKGDYVLAMVRASEIYHEYRSTGSTSDGIEYVSGKPSSPKELGLVGVIKLSQAEQYYNAMQQYVTEVVPCEGNTDERCSNAPQGFGVEVFPRQGEGGRPRSDADRQTATVQRMINGQVTAIDADRVTIKASTGALYIIGIGRPEIDSYNSAVPGLYGAYIEHSEDLQVKIGSWLGVMYIQTPHEDRKQITNKNIISVTALTGRSFSKSGGKGAKP